MTSYIPFWANDPTVLFNKDYILEMWPLQRMTFDEKLNAISRLVIILSILGFIITKSIRFLVIGIITLAIIYFVYKMRKEKIVKELLNKDDKEGFKNNYKNSNNIDENNYLQPTQIKINNPETLETYLKSDFEPTNRRNPLANVLLTEITDSPNRKAAPPAFNPEVYEDINGATKKMIQSLNPEIENTNKQLFGDLGEKFEFDQSMWYYYSTPNTKIPNDQGAFAEFLYGDMPSCRGGDEIDCVKDNFRYTLY
jgi:hypothetical protein